MKFAFIGAHAAEFHITTMCRVLLVSKAGYYAWVKRPPRARAEALSTLRNRFSTAHRPLQNLHLETDARADVYLTNRSPLLDVGSTADAS